MDLEVLNKLLKETTDDAKKKRDRILDGADIDEATHAMLYDFSACIQKEIERSHELVLRYLSEL